MSIYICFAVAATSWYSVENNRYWEKRNRTIRGGTTAEAKRCIRWVTKRMVRQWTWQGRIVWQISWNLTLTKNRYSARFEFSISKRELIQFKVRRLADLILEEKQKKEQKEKKENEEIKTRKDAERSSKVVSHQKIINCFKTTEKQSKGYLQFRWSIEKNLVFISDWGS